MGLGALQMLQEVAVAVAVAVEIVVFGPGIGLLKSDSPVGELIKKQAAGYAYIRP
ncbi:hypothetical protein [Roseateles koreensis]|uniref:Uncharacterized protein n=1 Tax=Roseateles koreensis TaxID=2987526 RepID=A0ABT5KU54_9BURK|nr:hypothetical protein [Roseateles koreensis]MDC8786461.1 hypothetical protein [Roseateles koreensis]